MELTHKGGSALSDHDPIMVDIRMQRADADHLGGRVRFFKANPALIKSQFNLALFKTAWIEGKMAVWIPFWLLLRPVWA